MSEQNQLKKRPNRRISSALSFASPQLNQVVPFENAADRDNFDSENVPSLTRYNERDVLMQRAFRLGSIVGIFPVQNNTAVLNSEVPRDKIYISKVAAKDWYIIRQSSWIVGILHTVAALCALWNLAIVPVDIAFQYSMLYSYGTSLDLACDVFIWVYIAALFFVTVVTYNDIELTDLKSIFMHRISSKSIWIDVLTSLPYEFMWVSSQMGTPQSIEESYPPDVAAHVMIQLLRLPKILRAANTLRFTFSSRQESSLVWSLINMILIYMIVVHFLACGLYFVGMYQVGPDHPRGFVRWVDLSGLSRLETPVMYRYTLSLYWSLIVITGTGFGDITAVTINEKMFMIFCLSCTVTTSALLFSGLFSIIEQLDAQSAAKQAYKEELMTYLELERVEKSIVGPLLDNTELYLAEEFIQSSIIFEKTPSLFQTRVYRAVYLEALSSFALTSTLSEKCRHALCCMIKIEVACIDEVLSEVGDVQTQLYLILRGSVLASDPQKGIEYGLLKRGGFFGEMVMMSDENVAKCRAPHLKAQENCCFATISRLQLKHVLREFPDDSTILNKIAICRARIFKHNALPPLDAHESGALFLMNVISTIASSTSQKGGSPTLRDSESSLWSRKNRTSSRPSHAK
jgi:hypothetical protein